MCFGPSAVKDLTGWNWDGDVIIHQPIVPSGRGVAGVKSRASYDIDVREYLASRHNAVIRKVLREELPKYLRRYGGSVARFEKREGGSFDYRAAAITNFVADTIRYQGGRDRDPWQFPDETLAIRAGDCEDRAFLLASLLLAAGISSFNIRVVFGQVLVDGRPHDHMWVMYKSERGHWAVIEPLRLGEAVSDDDLPRIAPAEERCVPDVEYRPLFLFNDYHLWAVRGVSDRTELDRFLLREWSRLDPKFAGRVHLSIVEEAILGVPEAPAWVLKGLKRNFSRLFLFGSVVESIDLNTEDYSPLDHFDNGYIAEGWARASQNLDLFRANSRENLQAFARAAHAIADFYAHSSYVHFAKLIDPESPSGHAPTYDPSMVVSWEAAPSYEAQSDFDLTDAKFSINESLWKNGKAAAAKRWADQLISGRYAQPHDTQAGLTNHLSEGVTSIPAPLRRAPGFSDRGSLPHHNQIAVDENNPNRQHCLYATEETGGLDRMSYANQLRWRRNTAVLHVREAFQKNFRASPE